MRPHVRNRKSPLHCQSSFFYFLDKCIVHHVMSILKVTKDFVSFHQCLLRDLREVTRSVSIETFDASHGRNIISNRAGCLRIDAHETQDLLEGEARTLVNIHARKKSNKLINVWDRYRGLHKLLRNFLDI